jgi:hypothetical protein
MSTKLHRTTSKRVLAICFFAGVALATSPLAMAQNGAQWNLQEKLKAAEAGNQWAAYDLWDAYHRGKHGVKADPAEAEKWLGKVVINVWVVRFEPVGDFAPKNPREFLARIHQYSPYRSGQTNIGAASFFRTTKQGDKLVGSFLSNYPDKLKTGLAKVPGLKVTSAEEITPQQFIKYEQSPQESL